MNPFRFIWLAKSTPTPTPTPTPLSDGQAALEVFTTDPFHYFNMNGLANDPVMQGMAATIYQTVQVIALCMLVLSLMWAVIKWGITPPAKKREGIISVVGWKLFLVAFLAAFVEIVTFLFVLFDGAAANLGVM